MDEVTELVQQLIRNRCVNDGSVESGGEVRNVDVLAQVLEGPGVDLQRYEAAPGRTSLVARIEGSDPDAPSICLLGHTDVVPVHEERWTHDPFGGELIAAPDGGMEVWGRGAIDMFNLTASMAVATRNLARSGRRPRGTLVYVAVADEEAGGHHGAEHLALHEADAVRTDYLITESGGFPLPSADGIRLPVLVAEKGTLPVSLRVHGTPGHGSMPFRTDNALVKAGEVARRIAEHRPAPRITQIWKEFVSSLGFPSAMTAPLTQEDGFHEMCEALPVGLGRVAYSCTHTTMAPTMLRAGSKLNIIPAEVDLELDVRTLPGDGPAEVEALLRDAVGDDLWPDVDFHPGIEIPATSSPRDTPLWDALGRVAGRFYEGSSLVPMLMTGGTDSRHFRRHLGTVSYGFGLFSQRLSMDDLAAMGHGDDERVDVESLSMVTEMWDLLLADLLT
jgi:acetylornithine deacetylase/succinyl-diaminopimelate desuccinylase-like protein